MFGTWLPRWFSSKEFTRNAGDAAGAVGSIPGLGRSPEEGNGKPFQYSCLVNPMGRGAWQVTVHGVTKSDTTEQLNNNKTNYGSRAKVNHLTLAKGWGDTALLFYLV